MEIIVFEKESYYRLQRELIRMFQDALKETTSKKQTENDWLSEEEASKFLPYKSKKKWQQLRNSGEIRFMQVGRKIRYSQKSILSYMDKYSLKV